MNRTILSVCFACLTGIAFAQKTSTAEADDPKPHDALAMWQQKVKSPRLSWGNIDVRYSRNNVPDAKGKSLQIKAWRGERVSGQAVLATSQNLQDVKLSVSDLVNGKYTIASSFATASFVGYVITDEFVNKEGQGGCGGRNPVNFDSSLVADPLLSVEAMNVEACTARPIWVTVRVPRDATPGLYKAKLVVETKNGHSFTLPFEVKVINRTLPTPHDWKFHLDLWQNPYAVARYYGVPLWSEAHFSLMRPLMKLLADAGQKVVTCSVMQHPWNGQTEDPFESMVTRIRHIDGTWSFNYAVFDKWVEFMTGLGIDGQINCYTLVPWALKFDYFDEASNSVNFVKAKPGDAAYEAYWLPFLKDFAQHLRAKGWMNRVAMAMDERPMEQMRAAFKLLHEADPEYKVSGAGNYYPEVEPQMYDLCLAYNHKLPADVWAKRREAGRITTYYTCCTEAYPNTFTFSAPAEATWIGWHAAAAGFDGYLRWAYNSWTKRPMYDTRFRTWAAGDCFMAYPSGSCIRMERLIEGIQTYEKVRLLREEFTRKGETKKLKTLQSLVSPFMPGNLNGNNATEMVNKGKKALGEIEN